MISNSIYKYIGYSHTYDYKSKTYFVTFHFQVNGNKCNVRFFLCGDAFKETVPMINDMINKDLRCIPMLARMYNALKEFDYEEEL